ncbi:hypothetical protein RQP46_001929 [Phenoliferia psychrophenolica]
MHSFKSIVLVAFAIVAAVDAASPERFQKKRMDHGNLFTERSNLHSDQTASADRVAATTGVKELCATCGTGWNGGGGGGYVPQPTRPDPSGSFVGQVVGGKGGLLGTGSITNPIPLAGSLVSSWFNLAGNILGGAFGGGQGGGGIFGGGQSGSQGGGNYQGGGYGQGGGHGQGGGYGQGGASVQY